MVGLRTWLPERAADAAAWAGEGRSWPPRAVLLAILGYFGWRHLADLEYGSIFSGITLGVHELGHLLFSPLGHWLGVAGGSITQVLAPLAVAYGFLRQRDYYAIAVAGAWESMSLSNLATYVADARAQELPLVSPVSGDPEHDWNYLLSSVGMLRQDTVLAGVVRLAAFLALAGSLASGIWLCVRMARSRQAAA
jgi:hypothetical protein